MKEYFGITLITIAIITLLIWSFSVFIQPILPGNINKSLVLFLGVLLGVVGVLVKIKEITEFFQSLFGDSEKNTKALDQKNNIIQSIRERVKFLKDLDEQSDPDKTEEKINDLIEFIEKLQHGDYFTKKVRELTHRPRNPIGYSGEESQKSRRITKEFNQQYLKQIVAAKNDILLLVEELIKLQ